MLSLGKPWRLLLLSLSLVALLLSACDVPGSGISFSSLAAPKYPARALVRRFDLVAGQRLRDVTGDFSVRQSGADTGILLLPREKIEIFASGKAKVQPGGTPSQPDGTGVFQCVKSAMPEPSLPCYSVVYSIGLYGRAGEVGARVEFAPTSAGNLFLGINAPRISTNSGSFHMTVLIIPPGAVAGLWATPADSFNVQGTSITLSAYAFGQNVTKLVVNFTLVTGQTSIPLCSVSSGVGNRYTCNWDLRHNGTYISSGKSVLGFSIGSHPQAGVVLAPVPNPDGLRTGIITYEKTQFSSNYAGYAAIDFSGAKTFQSVSGSWTVPVANCSRGEDSDVAIWIGMTPAPRNPASDNPYYPPVSPIYQIGTDSGCSGGRPHYFIAWEQFPQPLVAQPFPLQPGYVVTTAVSFQPGASGRGDFMLSISISKMIGDGSTRGLYTFQTPPLTGDTSASAMAECIVEAPTQVDPNTNQSQLEQLTNFGHVDFTCNYNNNEPIADGPQDYVYKMEADSFLPVLKAAPSNLDSTGAIFTVTWNHS